MSNAVISLYSDTETCPTNAMRAAIAAAEVGDEQKNADPTVLALQARVAGLLGKEAALWMPTGTMCNLVAIRTHTRPGDAIVADWMAHIVRAESGGSALASGVTIEPIRTARGIFTRDEAKAAITRATTVPPPYGQPVSLVCVEQTHNFGGGAVWPLKTLREVSRAVHGRGIAMHMDGARLMNASVAAGVPAANFRGLRRLGPGSTSRRDSVRRSARCWPGRRTSSATRGASSSSSGGRCARPGSRPPAACTRWTTTWSGSPRITRTRAVWRRASRRSTASRCRRRNRKPIWSSSTSTAWR